MTMIDGLVGERAFCLAFVGAGIRRINEHVHRFHTLLQQKSLALLTSASVVLQLDYLHRYLSPESIVDLYVAKWTSRRRVRDIGMLRADNRA
jgi:hypothetical protein